MSKPKLQLVGYELRKSVDGRKTVVDKLVPKPTQPGKIDVCGVLIDFHDTKGLASVARGRGCKLVPIYVKN